MKCPDCENELVQSQLPHFLACQVCFKMEMKLKAEHDTLMGKLRKDISDDVEKQVMELGDMTTPTDEIKEQLLKIREDAEHKVASLPKRIPISFRWIPAVVARIWEKRKDENDTK